MKKINIIVLAIIALIYIIIWSPIAYSCSNMWTDMLLGEFISKSAIALYWSFAFFWVLISILIVAPLVAFAIMFFLSNSCTSRVITPHY